VALKLREFGQEAYALAGGFDAWIQAGLPVVARDVVPELASQI